MRSIRERRGLRQLDLARLAGYSVRLIGKAEAGKPLSTETIEVLAEALSSAEHKISPQDLILNPISLAEDYLRAKLLYKEEAVSKINHFLSSTYRIRVVAENDIGSFEPAYCGNDGLAEYFQHFFRLFEPAKNADLAKPGPKFFESDNEVIIWGDMLWRPLEESHRHLSATMTSRLIFDDGMLVEQEDRMSIGMIQQFSSQPV